MKKLIGWIAYLVGIFMVVDAANFDFKTVLLTYTGLAITFAGVELKK